jgi:poly-gamma-glutamate system protein
MTKGNILRFRVGLARRAWVASRVSWTWLSLAAVFGVVLWQATEQFVRTAPHPQVTLLLNASRTAQAAQQEIARAKEQMGLLQPPHVDPNRTGLIGPDWSEITTTLGDLPAKRTVTNPDLSAALARVLFALGAQRGAAVALVLSGSFVGANVAAIAAVEAAGLRPVIVTSLGASMYGATDPAFTWLDMETTVRQAGIWQARSIAVVLGGEGTSAGGLDRGGRDMLQAAAGRNGHEPISAPGFDEVKQRVQAELAKAVPNGLVALVNSGGSVLAMGTCLDAYRLPTGVLRGPLPCRSGTPGLIHDFAGRGLPVVHLLNIKRLALDWGLPFDPIPLPAIGENPRIVSRLSFP